MAYNKLMKAAIFADDDWDNLMWAFRDKFTSDAVQNIRNHEELGWTEALEEALSPFDMEFLGSGHFSAVFTCPWDGSKVIKVGGFGGPQNIVRDGGLQWAAWAYKNKGKNPLIPVIHNIRVFEEFYVLLLDRLDEEHEDDYVYDKSSVVQAAFNGVLGRKMLSDVWNRPTPGSDKYAVLEQAYKDGQALRQLRPPRFNDLGGDNSLWFGDQIKFSDPIGYSSGNVTRVLKTLGVYERMPTQGDNDGSY